MERFTAILGGAEGERPVVEVPFDVKERFGRARAPVRGTVDGAAFRTTVAVYGGRYYLGFNKELRERAGIAIGDEVEVTLELDREPRTVEVPPGASRGARPGRRGEGDLRGAFLHPSERVRPLDRRRKARGDPRAESRAGGCHAPGRRSPPLSG